jgi:excinuclease ABC subunit A
VAFLRFFVHGGEIIAVGTPQQIADNPQSITGDYISGRQSIAVPKKRKKATQWLRIKGANHE